MNKQRKVVITTTYNEMGIIIDTKAEEVAQPYLQPTCNRLATDTISRQAAIDALDCISGVEEVLRSLPSAQPEIIHCRECKHWREGDAYSYCNKLFNAGVLDVYDYMAAEDDFCSKAERREE